MKWLDNLRARYRWSWAGTVEGKCVLTDDDGRAKKGGNRSSYWNLYVRGDGKRRASLIANSYCDSHAARVTRAEVRAWENGGPLPDLYKSPSPPRPKPSLVVFPGGRDGAA